MTSNQKMHCRRPCLNAPRQRSHSPPVMPQPPFPAPLCGFVRALCRFGGAFQFGAYRKGSIRLRNRSRSKI